MLLTFIFNISKATLIGLLAYITSEFILQKCKEN